MNTFLGVGIFLFVGTTTLPAPLKKIMDKGYVLKDDNKYHINHHRLEEAINSTFSADNSS